MDLVVIWNTNPEYIPWRVYIIKTRGDYYPKTNSVRLLLPGNKIISCTHARGQIVHPGDVTLSRYLSGQNLKDTWIFYSFTFMCKSLQIFGWNHFVKGVRGYKPLCAPGDRVLTKMWDVLLPSANLNTKVTKTEKERSFCDTTGVYFERNQVYKFEGSFKSPVYFLNYPQRQFYFYFFCEKAQTLLVARVFY